MTDGEFMAQQDRVRRQLEYWRECLGLDSWSVTNAFHRGDFPGEDADTQITAQSIVRWEYLRVHFDWNILRICELTDPELQEVVIHELMHVLVHEMRPEPQRNWQRAHEERVVSNLTNAAIWACEAATLRAQDAALALNG